MAEVVLGLLMKNLGTLIGQGFGLLWGVQKDMKRLSRILSAIRDVLEDAERKKIAYKPIANWLNNVKQAAYDANNVLDKWCTNARRLRRRAEALEWATNYGISKKVCESFSYSLSLRQIEFRLMVGKKFKKIISTFNKIAAVKDNFFLSQNVVSDRVQFEETSSLLDDGQVIKNSGTGLNAIFQPNIVQKKPEKSKEAEKPREKPKAPEKPPKEYKTSDGKKKEEKPREKPKKPEKPKEAEKPREKPKTPEKPREKPKPPPVLLNVCVGDGFGDGFGLCLIRPAPPPPPPRPAPVCASSDSFYSATSHSIIEIERLTSTWTIYQIPQHVPDYDPSVYTPSLVSIGPFHRHRPNLQTIEGDKTRFLMRYYNNRPIEERERLERHMKELEPEARNRYSGSYREINSENFVRMMIHDGYFVVELFRLYEKSHKEQVSDPIFELPWKLPVIRRDLLLLENQLPFFVLERVFELTSSGNEPSLVQLALNFFKPLLLSKESFIKTSDVGRKHDHLLGLFRSSFLPCEETERRPLTFHTTVVEGRPLIRSVTELKNKGIKFARGNVHNVLDIKFNHGVLEVPPLLIHLHTDSIFRNFMAYEFCHPYAQPCFTRYVQFLGNLLKSNDDFETLHKSKIIDSTFGNIEAAAKVFNNLGKHIDYKIDYDYLVEPSTNLNEAYENEWPGWKVQWVQNYWVQWVQNYCRTPWKIFSFLAAIIVLILNFTQTTFTVLPYFRPPS